MIAAGSGPAAGLRRIGTAAALRSFDPRDPFLRWEIPTDLVGPAFALGRAVIFARATRARGPGMAVTGPPGDVADLIDRVVRVGLLAEFPRRNVSVEADAFAVVEERFELGSGGDWHWMWTEAAPAGPDDPAVCALTEVDPRS
ncbi:MAG TPA: hypothetical protein VK020_03655 [Microlunatus sp.]|nr:hypothetical protein [Microlunatus sp.]